MSIKTIAKLTIVTLTFGFVAANAAKVSHPSKDELIKIANKHRVVVIKGNITANQALNCYDFSHKSDNINNENLFYDCLATISDKNASGDGLKEVSGYYLKLANETQLKLKDIDHQSLVDSIKQAQTTGSSFTSKQYDDYARMANVMTFANANSDANLYFKKQLARSAQDYIFKVTLDAQNKVAYEALRDTQNQATNQAILSTLLAMSDTLNQIKNDLNSNSCITGNCTVKASTEKEVSNNLTSDQLNAFAKGVLDEQAKQKRAVELPIFEGTQLTTK